jgi:hypothetical protein
MIRCLLCLLFLSSCLSLPAAAIFFNEPAPLDSSAPPPTVPLFSGTLLSFYAKNADPGRLSVQPFVFFNRRYGFYNADSVVDTTTNVHLVQTLLSLEAGLTKVIDATLLLTSVYARSPVGSRFHGGDTALYLGFQLMEDKKNSFKPDLRLVVGESLPTGVFSGLRLNASEVDFSGDGSFDTIFVLIWRKAFRTRSEHDWDLNLNLYYITSTKVEVNGLSIFGGDGGTSGVVTPGDQYICNVAYEYLFTKHWELGIDIRYEHQNSSGFRPNRLLGKQAGTPSSERLSLAPCIGYSRDENFSIEAGWWFSVWGRNAIAFASAAATIFYYF